MPAETKRTRSFKAQRQREAFLKAVREIPNVQLAAKLAKVGRATLYEWRKEDPAFAEEWDEALDSGWDSMLGAAMKRAKRKSDYLMMGLLRSRYPELRERLDLQLKNDPGLTNLVQAMAIVFQEYVPPERRRDAIARLASLTGIGGPGITEDSSGANGSSPIALPEPVPAGKG